MSQNALSGSRLFASKGCFACHSINEFGGTEAPDLSRGIEARSFHDMAAAMWNHLPGMARRMREAGTGTPHLDPWEAADLTAFLFWLGYFDPDGDSEIGAQLFVTKGCVVCHQVRGVGGVVGPNLDFLSQYGAPIQIAAAMWNHGPQMAAELSRRGVRRPTFAGSELVDLIAYLETANEDPPGGPLYVLPGRAEEGRRWYREKSCVECHGDPGAGGRIGPDLAGRGRALRLIEFAAAMWNKGPAMIRTMQSTGIPVPELSPAEMADIVAYLYSVRYFSGSGSVNRGRRYLNETGCLACHALAGRGGSSARDLTEARGLNSPAAVLAALWNHLAIESLFERGEQTWPVTSAAQMADLFAYLESLGRER